MNALANRRIAAITLTVVLLDQATKWIMLRWLGLGGQWVFIDGFFNFVCWGNTGAAWSLFRSRNDMLAIISVLALLGLFVGRRHFYVHSVAGQISLGLIFGGIIGNLIDRLHHRQVIDFLRFYINRRSGEELGFPAFNMADSAICIGVSLLILLSWKQDHENGSGRSAPDPASVP